MEKNRTTGSSSDALKTVIDLATLIPVPEIQEVIGPLNKIVGLFKPSPISEIKDELENINKKLNGIYGLMTEALEENDLQNLISDNLTKLSQINVSLSLSQPNWVDIKSDYKGMVTNYSNAAQITNRLLSSYEDTHKNDSGELYSYIGGFTSVMCNFYSLYAVLQYATNILLTNTHLEEPEDFKELVTHEQSMVIIPTATMFINRALSKGGSGSGSGSGFINFSYDYPSWCKSIFTQSLLKIESLDGREMKYSSTNDSDDICLSESYVKGGVCETFKISPNKDNHTWFLLNKADSKNCDRAAGLNTLKMGTHEFKYLVTGGKAEFIINFNGKEVTIQVEGVNGKTNCLGAEPHQARNVYAPNKGYSWRIVSL